MYLQCTGPVHRPLSPVYAGDTSDRKSTAGYIFATAGTAFSWSSKKEPTVATSTMEAEYIALFMASQQAAWIYQFRSQIGFPLDTPIEIFCDSQAAINVSKSEQTHRLSKHLDVKLHSIRERIDNEIIKLSWIKTEKNTADMLTKQLPQAAFKTHITGLGMEDANVVASEISDSEAEVATHLTPSDDDDDEN